MPAETTAQATEATAPARAAPEPTAPEPTAPEPTAPDVRIGDGARPEVATQIRLEGFEGPLGLLLTLIEARELDVLTVPLGALAGAYLEAVAHLDVDRIGNVSSFVAIAGQLILIKSRAMLPRHADQLPAADEPDPEAELRARLLLFRAYRDAGARLQERALDRIGLFRREPAVAQSAALAGARPAHLRPIDPAALSRSLARLVKIAPPLDPPPEVMGRTITLADRAAVIRAAIRRADAVVLQDLLRDVRDKVVVAVTFLAMLELVKRREIVVEQSEPWGPIVARKITEAELAAAGVAAADENEAIDESLESFR